MKKIGLFLDEIKDPYIDTDQKFSKLGSNTGNMLFWQSIKTLLDPDIMSRWYIEHSDELDLRRYKAFITTDLVWIRQQQDFSYMNKMLDAVDDLPLIPISIGLQSDDFLSDFSLHSGTVKVLERISERCVMGVRGEYTAEILTKYGIKNFKIIGCPSMYMNAPGLLTVNNAPKAIEKVSINFETFYRKLTPQKTAFLEYAARNGYGFVEQTQAVLEEQHISNKEKLETIQKWIKEKSACFFSIDEWRNYLKNYDFSMGMRFHGNVLAMWENVPALFVTCDSRTKELCRHFSLPSIDVKDFDESRAIDYYYEKADYDGFHKNYKLRLKEMEDFLIKNNLLNQDDNQMLPGKLIYDKKPKKVFISLGHMAGLFQAVALKYHVYGDCDVTLLVASDFAYSEFAAKLVENGIFKQIIFYIDRPTFNQYLSDGNVSKEYSNEDWQSLINEYFDNILKKRGVNIKEFDQIITVCDVNNNFYLYCFFNEIQVIFMELCEKQFEDSSRYSVNQRFLNGSAVLEELNRKHFALSGESDNVPRRLLWGERLEKVDEKDVRINFLELFYNIPEKDRNRIIDCLNAGNLIFDNFNLLLVNSPGWSMPKTNLNMPFHYYPFILIADYYFKDASVTFKDHPQAGGKVLNNWLDDSVSVLEKEIPIEFYSLIKGFRVNHCISVGSSGSTKIERFVNETVTLNPIYLQNYKMLHKFYAAFLLDGHIGIPKKNYHIYGVDKEFISTFKKYVFSPFPEGDPHGINPRILKGNIFTVIGEVPSIQYDNIEFALKNADLNTCVVLLNDFVKNLKDDELMDHIVPVLIKKRQIRDKILCDTETEHVYFFCKNKDILNKVSLLDHKKILKYVGIELHILADNSKLSLIKLQIESLSEQLKSITAKVSVLNRIIEKSE